jgi:hypothetical protein
MNEENKGHSEMRAQRTVGFFVLSRGRWSLNTRFCAVAIKHYFKTVLKI